VGKRGLWSSWLRRFGGLSLLVELQERRRRDLEAAGTEVLEHCGPADAASLGEREGRKDDAEAPTATPGAERVARTKSIIQRSIKGST
jgi:hypothetical protein